MAAERRAAPTLAAVPCLGHLWWRHRTEPQACRGVLSSQGPEWPMLQFLAVPAILFMAIVAPLWLIFHYVTLWKTQRQAGRVDPASLKDMWGTASRLENR